MSEYQAPLEEIKFVLEVSAGLKDWPQLPGFEEAGEELISAVLEEASKLTRDIIAPTNAVGDSEGASLLDDGTVKTPDCFKTVNDAFVEGGWPTLPFDPDYGGQGLPATLALAVSEMVTSANMAYSLGPMLTSGAIEAIRAHGSDDQKALFLPNMIAGRWTGAMNLTESGAGSDVGALKTKAEPQADGTYLISGQKIYITWGDHDLAENVIHLVLARLADAPPGTKGISMFIVPKYLVKEDGTLGKRNDVKCVSLEHKLGIHASPTCVMAFGENEECVGYLVGQENQGMRNMFTMMNHARVSVGLEGVALSERAYQHAVRYALERIQSSAIGSKSHEAVAIIEHPDVRRLLLTIRASTEAARAIIYRNAWAIDQSHKLVDADARRRASGEADLLTPISKAYATDLGVENSSHALQVFGGMGFVEETGAAQFYRDARIAPIYEGTNGIQGLDLAGRKLMMDGGEHWRSLIAEMKAFAATHQGSDLFDGPTLWRGIDALSEAAETLFNNGFEGVTDTASAATPYLRLFGTVLGGYMLAQQAVIADERLEAEPDHRFYRSKIVTAQFFIEQLLPSATALLTPIKAGGATIMALESDMFLTA